MKIIDLINRIHEGTQPSHISFNNEDWYWNNYDGYVTKESLKITPDAQLYLHDRYILMFALDKEVEIIEEKKIPEKLNEELASSEDMLYKINEIIDYLESQV